MFLFFSTFVPMVKNGFHTVFSMLMAFLVLFSTLYITIEKHLCGDVVIDVAVFTQAEKCKMETFEMEQAALTKQNCCKDELEIIKGQDVLKLTPFEDLHFDQQVFLTTLIYSYSNVFEGLPEQINPNKDYSPPNLVADILVLDQVFII
ncbi:MAG TPA: hypothetical protein VKZ98_02085 [Aquaticitalea sp.]|nr:hypothetical protein [Aquaticitalea sp.]